MVSGALMLLIFFMPNNERWCSHIGGKRMMETTYYCKIQTKGTIKALRTKKKGVLQVWIGRIFTEDPKAVILESYAR